MKPKIVGQKIGQIEVKFIMQEKSMPQWGSACRSRNGMKNCVCWVQEQR